MAALACSDPALFGLRLTATELRKFYQRWLILVASDHGIAWLSSVHDQWRQLRAALSVFTAVDAPSMYLLNARPIGQLDPLTTVVDVPGCRIWAHYEQAERFHEISVHFLLKSVPA